MTNIDFLSYECIYTGTCESDKQIHIKCIYFYSLNKNDKKKQ